MNGMAFIGAAAVRLVCIVPNTFQTVIPVHAAVFRLSKLPTEHGLTAIVMAYRFTSSENPCVHDAVTGQVVIGPTMVAAESASVRNGMKVTHRFAIGLTRMDTGRDWSLIEETTTGAMSPAIAGGFLGR